jgi:prepilin-type N-terminal cleavage/methylation domain-containing protein/prepilin-type processing-associated H-X9-DG protein
MDNLSQQSQEAADSMRADRRRGFTLVELLTAIGIALVLMAMLFPALTAAREASRNSACKNNLRQLGLGLQDNAALDGKYCTGAFDWFGDGCVTEIGWVADLVNKGVTVGKMLCPSNPAKTSETYYDLLSGNATTTGATPSICAEMKDKMLGGPSYVMPDGVTTVVNPCRAIIDTLAVDTEPRRTVVEEDVYKKFYNTNYTASWFLVRMGVEVDSFGSLPIPPCGDTDPANLFCTEGPLKQTKVDLLDAPSNTLPLLGCGAAVSETLPMAIGDAEEGTPMAQSFTNGPRMPDLAVPNPHTVKGGATGWWAIWNSTRQDYRGFAPVHRGNCNLLFTDGSVRSVKDTNRDGYLNSGFPAGGGFIDDTVELPTAEVFNRWSLQGPFPD